TLQGQRGAPKRHVWLPDNRSAFDLLVVAAWKDAKRRSLVPLEIAVTERDACCRAGTAAAGHRPVLNKRSWGHRALVIVLALFYRS
ncbi:hypothetical protein EI555_014570, partial [Monodon monoceros]